MLEIFKMWVSSMLCLGIFITFLQLIVPKTNLKKHIYALVGVITIITIISPVVDLLKEDSINNSVSQVIASISDDKEEIKIDSGKYDDITKKAVIDELSNTIENDIRLKLKDKSIDVTNVYITLNESYSIEKIEIYVEKNIPDTTSISEIAKYINIEYGIDYSKISVIKEG